MYLSVYLTNSRVYATVLRLSSVVCTECIVAKRRVLEQKVAIDSVGPIGSRI